MNNRLHDYFAGRRLLITVFAMVVVFGFPYLLAPVANVILVLFAGVLLAVFLDALNMLIRKILPIPHLAGLLLALLLIVLFFAGFGFFAGPRVVEQSSQLADRLPRSLETIQSQIDEMPVLQKMLQNGGGKSPLVGDEMLGKLTSFFAATFGVIANTVIVIFVGIYVAFNPLLYKDSLIRLIPRDKRSHGREVMGKLGRVLRWWLVGRLSSMAVVGVLTAIGLFLIGEPLALILGLIAGLLSFIPFLGPVLSAVPAVLIGLTRGFQMAIWVILVFVIVQMLESNLITPIIQRKAVMLPPAFLIAAQFLLGVLAGFMGILLATPLTVVVTVLVQLLYIQDVLGDSVSILGQHQGKEG